ncbi:phytoene desaturase family protein [Nocardia amamiensis]|uniref:phytoene desaturase family protein n=1 Tax=Nocardia amamiensis TaxID=404578 RepID=UPI000833300F|nr:NAD(P)/FAD-dependent oxidoreductase [Nocardia amamiensis]
MTTAIVIGSGPNGLAAAVTLARHGVDVTVLEGAATIGGGTRSGELTLPGLLHDHCAMAHPMAVGSPFLTGIDAARYGLKWAWPEIDCVHPLDDGTAGVLYRSVDDTAAGLGRDGSAWRRVFAGPSAGYDLLATDFMQPLVRRPSHPLRLARFGLPTLMPATALGRLFRTEQGRALFAGNMAHGWQPQHRILSAAIGLGITTAGHRYGWPVAVGGSRAITDAMAAALTDLGGKIETGLWVESLGQLPPTDMVMFDLAPAAIADIAGDRLPSRVSRAYRRFRYGPAAYKVSLAVEGGIPWTNPQAGKAGSLHVCGNAADVVRAERAIRRGQLPERPFIVVGQQYLADRTRSRGNVHPIDLYAHVPQGYSKDATDVLLDAIERFAPGFRDRIVAAAVVGPTDMQAYNPNYVAGDILTGDKNIRQLICGGPRITVRPYHIADRMFICSAAVPPGPGAHGMSGYNAAIAALREFGVPTEKLAACRSAH